MPTLHLTTSGFKTNFGFLHAIGCPERTHIAIKQPNEKSQDYFLLQKEKKIFDEKRKFIDVETKSPGSIPNARMFTSSNVNKLFLNKKFK